MRLTWVRGHAKWRHIFSGEVQQRDAIGNGQADRISDMGHEALGAKQAQTALDYHAEKQQSYERLVERLQKLAVGIYKAGKLKREEAGTNKLWRKAEATWIQQPLMPDNRTDFIHGEGLALLTIPPDMASDPRLAELYNFWSATRWRLEDSTAPTTWLELFTFSGPWEEAASCTTTCLLPSRRSDNS